MRSRNREQFPRIAALVDDLRKQGIDVTVKYCKEGNYELGLKPNIKKIGVIRRPIDGVETVLAKVVISEK